MRCTGCGQSLSFSSQVLSTEYGVLVLYCTVDETLVGKRTTGKNVFSEKKHRERSD